MKQIRIKQQQIELLSGILGCFILLLFGKLLGNNGMAYLCVSYLSICVVQTAICGGVPEGVGKILKARHSKGQYRNVTVTQRRIGMLQGVLSILAAVLFTVTAGVLAEKAFQMHYSTVIIRILAVSLCFRGLYSVMLGCFPGEEKEGAVVLLPLIRWILVLLFGFLFANRLGTYGMKVSDLLGNEAYRAMYAGTGVAMAISLTEIILFLLVCVYFMSKRRRYNRNSEDGMRQVDSVFDTLRSFCGTVWIPCLLYLLPVLTLWLGMFIYRKYEQDSVLFAECFGMLCGKFLPMCGIPVLIICFVLQIKQRKVVRFGRSSYQKVLRMAVVSALFFAMYFAVMSAQLAGVFGQNGSKALGDMFAYGSTLILFSVLFFYFSHLLIMFEKRTILPGIYALLTLVFGILSFLLLKQGIADAMALIYAGIISIAIGTFILGFLCSKLLHVNVDWLRTVVIPIVIVAATGILCMLLGKLFTPHLGDFITALVCLLISGIIYWLVYKKTSFY